MIRALVLGFALLAAMPPCDLARRRRTPARREGAAERRPRSWRCSGPRTRRASPCWSTSSRGASLGPDRRLVPQGRGEDPIRLARTTIGRFDKDGDGRSTRDEFRGADRRLRPARPRPRRRDHARPTSTSRPTP